MKKEIYKMASRVMKDTFRSKVTECTNCFVQGVRAELNAAHLYDYDEYNGSYCARVLFYLEDLGAIKILQGVSLRDKRVECRKLKIKVLHSFEYNKI